MFIIINIIICTCMPLFACHIKSPTLTMCKIIHHPQYMTFGCSFQLSASWGSAELGAKNACVKSFGFTTTKSWKHQSLFTFLSIMQHSSLSLTTFSYHFIECSSHSNLSDDFSYFGWLFRAVWGCKQQRGNEIGLHFVPVSPESPNKQQAESLVLQIFFSDGGRNDLLVGLNFSGRRQNAKIFSLNCP